MRRDDIRESRRAIQQAKAIGEQAWLRVPDSGGGRGGGEPFAIVSATAAGGLQNQHKIDIGTIKGFFGGGNPTINHATAANLAWETGGYTVLPYQEFVLKQGDFPSWRPSTTYAANTVVTYDNGAGLKRWSKNVAGDSGATFTPANWTELEDASGWHVAYVPPAVYYGVAQSASNLANLYAGVDVQFATAPAYTGTTFGNPLALEIAVNDVVAVVAGQFAASGFAGSAAFILSVKQAGGGGGEPNTDELVATANGQTPGYLGSVITGHPGPLGNDEYNVEWTVAGPVMYAKVVVPDPSVKPRFVTGQCTADVAIGNATFTIDNTRALSSGSTPGATVTVHNAIGSYVNNDWVVAVWDETNSEYRDITVSRYTRLRGRVNEASGVSKGSNNWNVDTLELLEGCKYPGLDVQAYDALRAYDNNDEVELVWNDTLQRWEDATKQPTDLQVFDFIVEPGQSLSAGSWETGLRSWNNGAGTVRLLDENGDEAGTQAVEWEANVAVSPPSGQAYRGWGLIVDGTYKAKAVYTCDGVTWSAP